MRKTGPGPGGVAVAELPDPEPGPGEAVVDLVLAGVCHTDVSMVQGNRAATGGYRPRFPLVLGHEFVGRVSALGPGAAGPAVGTRVVGSAHVTCRRCAACRAGRSMLCPALRVLGLDVDGVYADRFVVPAVNLVGVPDGVEDRLAALAEPFAVAAHAVDLAGVAADEPVAVVGPGAVGLLVAGVLGFARVTVFGRPADAGQLDLVRSLGATGVGTVPADVRRLAGRYAAVFETAGYPDAVAAALTLARTGGRVVCVGLPSEPTPVDTAALARSERALVGSRAYDLSTWAGVPARLAAVPQLADLVSHVLPGDQLDLAVRLIDDRAATKVLLRPPSHDPARTDPTGAGARPEPADGGPG